MPRGLPTPCRRLAPWLLTLALVPLPAGAEPVPVTLWGLIDQAEVVVLAEVERVSSPVVLREHGASAHQSRHQAPPR